MKAIISEYFGAANGYEGFRSYFKEIFNPLKLTRLFVIKGGPGTGKSSMMKKIESHFRIRGCETEKILCSSDPKSLDGIIIKSGMNKIALLDGTAPHQTDASYPGAIDEIINLAEGLDYKKLSSKREQIIELNEEKKTAYKEAYRLLNLAGVINKHIQLYFSETIDYSKAERLVSDILSVCNFNKKYYTQPKLTSAFCKDGLVSCKAFDLSQNKVLCIGGMRHSAYIIMDRLMSRLTQNNAPDIYCPSPLSASNIDGICSEGFIISITHGDAAFLAPDVYISNEIKELISYNKSVLDMARGAFIKASHSHFALEDIYTNSIDFRCNDQTTNKLVAEIDEMLA